MDNLSNPNGENPDMSIPAVGTAAGIFVPMALVFSNHPYRDRLPNI